MCVRLSFARRKSMQTKLLVLPFEDYSIKATQYPLWLLPLYYVRNLDTVALKEV